MTHSLNKFICCLLCILFISSCSAPANIDYNYQPPQNQQGLACIHTCMNQLETCQAECTHYNNQQLYFTQSAQFTQNTLAPDEGYIAPTNFAEYHHNTNTQCGCQRPYNECYENCGGKVTVSS